MADSSTHDTTPASNITPTSSNTTIDTQSAPSATTSVVRTTTDDASQVFYTPELLELILSKLGTRGLLVRASLVCRAFKTTIESSPTINKSLEFVVVDFMDAPVAKKPCGHHYCKSLKLHPVLGRPIFNVVLDFSALPIERHLPSPSFRKLRMIPQCDFSRAYQLMVFLTVDEFVPSGTFVFTEICEEKSTIVELLEILFARVTTKGTIRRLTFFRRKVDEVGSA